MTDSARDAAQFGRETSPDGDFVRQTQRFRSQVSSGPDAAFPPEAGRYHLYVSYACPWASRVIAVRRLKGLEQAIGMTVVDPERDELGWRFGNGEPGTQPPDGEPDPVNGWRHLSEGYLASDPAFDDRVTVPVLWDKQAGTIVNNESSELMRMLGQEFNEVAENPSLDLYPEDLRERIDGLNQRVYDDVNNGVYKAGFATTQAAYERAVRVLFDSLGWLEDLLSQDRYLTGPRLTEADLRLAMTLFRFDAVYVSHFKCSIRRLVDYPNLWSYARDIYQHPGVAETVNFDHIKRHYYRTHPKINPTRIVPLGPEVDWLEPHGRG